jgi:hypothetical protein
MKRMPRAFFHLFDPVFNPVLLVRYFLVPSHDFADRQKYFSYLAEPLREPCPRRMNAHIGSNARHAL